MRQLDPVFPIYIFILFLSFLSLIFIGIDRKWQGGEKKIIDDARWSRTRVACVSIIAQWIWASVVNFEPLSHCGVNQETSLWFSWVWLITWYVCSLRKGLASISVRWVQLERLLDYAPGRVGALPTSCQTSFLRTIRNHHFLNALKNSEIFLFNLFFVWDVMTFASSAFMC